MRYHFLPTRKAIIRKIGNKYRQEECGENEALICCRWECKMVQLLWKTVWQLLKKLNTELPYDPATPLLDT
uniref:Uncharacterized protein n=2 Tax=Canis lupus familiaris TaxID=9615 RepID=A0A8I3RRF5_CANLF